MLSVKGDLFLDVIDLVIYGFIHDFEKKLTDPLPSRIPNDISRLICGFYQVSTKMWDGAQYHYGTIYNALNDIDFEHYNMKVSIPEFLFFGFDNARRIQVISQVANIDARDFPLSHYVFRCKLIHNPQAQHAIIKVNGALCRNGWIPEIYVNSISKDIFDLSIESCHVRPLTFVHLPDLIPNARTMFGHYCEGLVKYKRQIDEVTTWFLHQQNPDGSYRYMPILVRQPTDPELDTHFEVRYIDDLIQKYDGNVTKRLDWMSDTLNIVNKFNCQINRSPASNLIEYMKYCAIYGETVLTMTNAKYNGCVRPKMLTQESQQQLMNAARHEEERWEHVLSEFSKMDDEDLDELKLLREAISGIGKMNQILTSKICDIVKRALPSVERQLRAATHQKNMQIRRIIKQMENDPHNIKRIMFNNKCLKYFREFYNGEITLNIDTKYRKSWCQEWSDFKNYMHHTGLTASTKWMYEIQPTDLYVLLGKNSPLSGLLHMDLIGAAAINRIIDAWICMVSYMPFPLYSDEDVVNASGAFAQTRQPELWTSIRNLVLDAVEPIRDAVHLLGHMMAYKLKGNANSIFEYVLVHESGGTDFNKHGDTLRDYNAQVDCIINEFIVAAEMVPEEQANILDKTVCEEIINNSALIHKLLQDSNKDQQNRYDSRFYEELHGQNIHHLITFENTKYDIALIRHLSQTFWTHIKCIAIRTIVQKVTHLVMAPVTQHDDRMSNAIQCDREQRDIQELVHKLATKTGVEKSALYILIGNAREINDLDDRETLIRAKQKCLQELQEIRELKAKIDTIQNVSYSNWGQWMC